MELDILERSDETWYCFLWDRLVH